MTPDTDDGRVTLAVLATKLDHLTDLVEEIRPDHDRLLKLEAWVATNTGQIAAQDKRIEKLDTSRRWEWRVEALAAAIVGMGAWLKP